MKNLLIGVLLGALIGAGATYYFGLQGDAREAAAVAEEKNQSQIIASHSAIEASPSAASSNTYLKNPQSVTAGQTSDYASSSLPSNTPVVPTPPTSAISTKSVKASSRTGSVEPIRVDDAARNVLDVDSHFTARHAQLESEPADDSWSIYMKQILESFFIPRASGVGIEILNIECRTTACEIQAFDRRGSGGFDTLLRQARQESWWQFDQFYGRGADHEGGEALIAIFDRVNKK